jgi:hypothetical protein
VPADRAFAASVQSAQCVRGNAEDFGGSLLRNEAVHPASSGDLSLATCSCANHAQDKALASRNVVLKISI